MTLLSVGDGGMVTVRTDAQTFTLPVKSASELPSRVAGLPHGLPGTPVLPLPLWAEVKKAQ
jgi:hypothetical protein